MAVQVHPLLSAFSLCTITTAMPMLLLSRGNVRVSGSQQCLAADRIPADAEREGDA